MIDPTKLDTTTLIIELDTMYGASPEYMMRMAKEAADRLREQAKVIETQREALSERDAHRAEIERLTAALATAERERDLMRAVIQEGLNEGLILRLSDTSIGLFPNEGYTVANPNGSLGAIQGFAAAWDLFAANVARDAATTPPTPPTPDAPDAPDAGAEYERMAEDNRYLREGIMDAIEALGEAEDHDWREYVGDALTTLTMRRDTHVGSVTQTALSEPTQPSAVAAAETVTDADYAAVMHNLNEQTFRDAVHQAHYTIEDMQTSAAEGDYETAFEKLAVVLVNHNIALKSLKQNGAQS